MDENVRRSNAPGAASRSGLWRRCWLLAWVLIGCLCLVRAVPGLRAQAPGSTMIPIEDLEVGDYVQTYDFETGEVTFRQVLEVYRGYTYDLVDIGIGDDTLSATLSHRFWVESEELWLEAAKLQPGMQVRLADGRLRHIESVDIRHLDEPEATFNLEVEGDHNYFVGRGHVLVHNGSTPHNQKGHWNYVLKNNKGKVYYTGRAGPKQTEGMVKSRHKASGRYGPNKANPKKGDTFHKLTKGKNQRYDKTRVNEHNNMVKYKTHAKVAKYKNTAGSKNSNNRIGGVSARQKNNYYPKGKGWKPCY
jgi:hypothetical protein